MLKSSALVFPFVQFITDNFPLFKRENNPPIFYHEIGKMLQQEAFLIEDILSFDELNDLIWLIGESLMIVLTF